MNCFTLTRKTAPDAGPVTLQDVDAEMCAHFGAPVHERFWYRGWYNVIGLALSMGSTFARMREISLEYPETLAIIDWLDANFESNAWYQPGRGA